VVGVLEPSTEDLFRLVTLAADADPRYEGLLLMWHAVGPSPRARLTAWKAWAGTFPSKPARGRAWKEAVAAADLHGEQKRLRREREREKKAAALVGEGRGE